MKSLPDILKGLDLSKVSQFFFLFGYCILVSRSWTLCYIVSFGLVFFCFVGFGVFVCLLRKNLKLDG